MSKHRKADKAAAWSNFQKAEKAITECCIKMDEYQALLDGDGWCSIDSNKDIATRRLQKLIKKEVKQMRKLEKEIDRHATCLRECGDFDMSKYVAECTSKQLKKEADESWKRECDEFLERERPCKIQRGNVTAIVSRLDDSTCVADDADADDADDGEVDVLVDSTVPHWALDKTDKANFYTDADDADGKEAPSMQTTSGALRVGKYRLPPDIASQLHPHQVLAVKKAVQVLGINKESGFLLAHSMGLGKTFTTIAVLELLSQRNDKFRAIIISPKTVRPSWRGELFKWNSAISFRYYTEDVKSNVDQWKLNGGLLWMGYDRFRIEQLSQPLDPDLLIVDEAHILKNVENLNYVAVSKCSCRKLLLTGTPIQNNLMEYHNMINIIQPDLFDAATFKKKFSTPIERGAMADASENEISQSRKAIFLFALNLKSYMDRRSQDVLRHVLPRMHDFKLTYEVSGIECMYDSGPFQQQQRTIDFAHADKMEKACTLIDAIMGQTSDSVLVFSKRIDVIEKLQKLRPGPLMCGKLSDNEREQLVEDFALFGNRIFYLTVAIGAVGLNLQKANRIIILEPSFNPVTDNQACFRAYRLGQTKEVFIYRFVVARSIEEKIYSLSVHKTLSACRILDDRFVDRHFTKEQLNTFKPDDGKKLTTTADTVLNTVLREFSSCSSHDLLFAESQSETLSDLESADAENQYNIECNKRSNRQLMVKDVLHEVPIDSIFFGDWLLLPPLKICYAGVSSGVHSFSPIIPECSCTAQYNVEIWNNNEIKTFGPVKSTMLYSEWHMKLKHGTNYLRAKVMIDDKESDWSEWSAPVIV